MHPLRSNSVSQESSPSASARQPMSTNATNPTSFAARSQAKPALAVDTSPPQPRRSRFATQEAAADLYSPEEEDYTPTQRAFKPRKNSVPERSPLQKLEVTLGDMTKEEKRARVEEAERNLRAKKEGGISSSSSKSIPRKPVGSANGEVARTQSQSTSHPNSDYGSDEGVFIASSGRRYRKTPLGLEPFPSRDRAYGYDASRGIGAASAALGAYQSTRSRPSQRSPNYASNERRDSAQDRGGWLESEYARVKEQGRDVRENGHVAEARSTGNREPTAIPQSQKQLQTDRTGAKTGAKIAQQVQDEDPVSREQVRNSNPGPTYSVPPQTAAGQRAHEQVGPPDDLDELQEGHEEYGGRGGRLKFSQIIHPFSDGTGRRYKDSEYLDDYKAAATGTLTGPDLDLEPTADHQTWWERDSGTKHSRKPRASAPAQTAGGYEDSSGRTAFNPPLNLKCGPLLRYTGMRNEAHTDSAQATKFWRGSVMILTQDATSSDEAAPTLRMFRQPMELYRPPMPNGNQSNPSQHSLRKDDPVAGQLRSGPTGESLYVKHINQITPELDLSQVEDEGGLFTSSQDKSGKATRLSRQDGEKVGRFKEVKGHRLHAERGLTFWRFNIEVQLGLYEERIAYRINNGPAVGFWVPGKDQMMNIMFHSCNGFSLSVDPNNFSGPDPLWRDVLNNHQQRPFHVMIGGGDQIYNDAAMRDTRYFKEWLEMKNPEHKYTTPFSEAMQDDLENFYLHRYAMWFSQGLFGMANSQIPMINIWDDHDIIDGYGSYPHHFMSCPVFTGLGAVAFKYYMLFQHQSLPTERTEDEPSWIRGASRGPYINQFSRSVYMSLGNDVAFVGLDCRTERLRDEVLSDESYKIITERLYQEIQKGQVRHLIVLLGIPIAYPRMTFAENILTSRAMDPIKALARTGIMGGVLNKFDGGVEVLDDLDDHWTAKHHKIERNWLIQDLQDFAADKSVRVTILGGDVHLAAIGEFYTKKKLSVPKDRDHRYTPNIISSAIVNTPPPETMADFLNKRNKVHHLDDMTDEDMIPLFTYDVDGKSRNNHHLLPRRNYCMIRPYISGNSPPPSEYEFDDQPLRPRRRSFTLGRRNSWSSQDTGRRPSLLRRLSNRVAPPSSFRDPRDNPIGSDGNYSAPSSETQLDSLDGADFSRFSSQPGSTTAVATPVSPQLIRRDSSLRRPNIGSDPKVWDRDPSGRQGHIDLSNGLEVVMCCEINQKDPSGKTMPYRLIIPALDYQDDGTYHQPRPKRMGIKGMLGSIRRGKGQRGSMQEPPYEISSPTTPATHGDQHSARDGNDVKRTSIAKHDPTRAAGGAGTLDGTVSHDHVQAPKQDLRERATLDSLPRSGVVETEIPPEVPAQPYYEQRRGSLDQSRAHASTGRSRSLTRRSNSIKRSDVDQHSSSTEDRAYWGAQQVRGESQSIEPKPSQRKQERGLRRYYASPFESNDAKSPTIPANGLVPPLGAVNNRIDLMPSQTHQRVASDGIGANREVATGRRVASDPARDGKGAARPAPHRHFVQPSQPVQKVQRPKEKDPYAHYMPEAVEAEFQSGDDVSELENGLGSDEDDQDDPSEVSSPASPRDKSHGSRGQNAHNNRESFVSAQTNTSVAQNQGQDSPLFSDEDDLDNMTRDHLTPSPPPRSPERPRGGNPQARPVSKIERLTGESSSGQRASYASGGTFDDEVVAGARPVGQGASGKAAKMLGAQEDELDAFESAGVGRRDGYEQKSGGKIGGLARSLSERGGSMKRRLSGRQ